MDKRPTFMGQSLALFKRNLLIKRRNIRQFLAQLFVPMVIMAYVMIALNSFLKLRDIEEVANPLDNGTNWFDDRNLKHFKTSEWIIGPKNNFTDIMVSEIEQTLKLIRYSNMILKPTGNTSFTTLSQHINNSFSTAGEMLDYYNQNSNNFAFAVIFDEITNTRISYTIRMPINEVPNTDIFGNHVNCRDHPFDEPKDLLKKYDTHNKCHEMDIYIYGFTFVQTIIDSTIIRILTPNNTDAVLPIAKLQLYPKHSAKVPIGSTVLSIALGITIIFSQLMPIMTSNLVKEKEKRIKDAMFMMGLRPTVYWLVWFILEGIVVLILALLVSIVYTISGFIPNTVFLTTFSILFVMISLFGLSLIELSAIYSKFFYKEKTSTQLISLMIFFSFGPIVLVSGIFITIQKPFNYLLILFSPCALTFGIHSILSITYINGLNLGLNTLFMGSDISIGISLISLFVDNILYSLLALYLDRVIPEEFGSNQSFCFCFEKNYWFPQKTSQLSTDSSKQALNLDIEEVSPELRDKSVICIKNITKRFRNEKTLAVNNVSMNIYSSQITALLGHNGAGKTTLINMIIGAIAPSSGSISIHGYDVTDPAIMQNMRSMFGVCLQENTLLDELNSEEHLIFFGQMKGLFGNELVKEVNELLHLMDLYTNRFTESRDLSGGQKRKLCIAIALIGGPKVVILDEPTSGVDVAIRRQIWSILQLYKTNKTVIMTTHFMEEADILCDRKAILTKGSLRCVGSSLFLKNKFGIGYHLTVDVHRSANIEDIKSLVTADIPTARLDRKAGTEVFYVLPLNESQKFSKLFHTLEKSTQSVNSFGISMTTLEEVFLKLEDESEANATKMNPTEESTKHSNTTDISISEVTYRPQFWNSFCAYLYIKCLLIKRNPWHLISLNIGIVIVFVIIFILFLTMTQKTETKRTVISPAIYDKQNAVLKYLNNANQSLTQFTQIVSQLGAKPEEILEINLQTLANSYMAVIINSFTANNIEWQWLFNETYLYSLPILQNLMANAYFKLINNQNYRLIQTSNQPLLLTQAEENSNPIQIFLVIYTIFYVITFSITIGQMFAFDTIDDRETKIIETIRISGMGFWCYWLTNLFIHTVLLVLELLFVYILLTILIRVEYLETFTAKISFIIHIIASSIALMQTNYVFGHLFATKSTAQLLTLFEIIITVIVVFILIVVGYVLGLNPIFAIIFFMFGIVWPLIPTILGHALIYLLYINSVQHLYFPFLMLYVFLNLLVSFMFYMFILKLIDSTNVWEDIMALFGSKASDYIIAMDSPLEDEDVINERREVKQVLHSKHKKPILLIHGLRKVFRKSHCLGLLPSSIAPEIAVNNLSLIVEKNNILGLLGPNGAGKTTAMRVIIKQEQPTAGLVKICDQEIDSENFHKLIAYCPQHDTLWKDITVREHLKLFATIHGVYYKQLNAFCNKHLYDLKVAEHADKRTEHLSGGTKRKLCYILSLMGESKLVLLDEPSTGMDPYAKRFLWTTIQNNFNKSEERSAVLTTHSMEEATALCTRIAIMTKGVMRCIGSVQHLNNKYGAGYVLDIKWDTNKASIESIKQIISNIFAKWTVREVFGNRMTADIPQQSVQSLSNVFSSLDAIKMNATIGVEEYSLSQTTLEQVFIHFAKDSQHFNV